MLGSVEYPDIEDGLYLVDILFRVGPVRSEAPLVEGDLEPYERRRGIELAPWQADLLLDLSKAYFSEMRAATKPEAPAPWPPARKAWKYVMDRRHGAKLDEALDEPIKENNGSRKRHRNPPPG